MIQTDLPLLPGVWQKTMHKLVELDDCLLKDAPPLTNADVPLEVTAAVATWWQLDT